MKRALLLLVLIAPVADKSFVGVWAAVARKSFVEERLGVERALRSYTADAAYACFSEDRFGRIEVEMFADFLSNDLFGIPLREG